MSDKVSTGKITTKKLRIGWFTFSCCEDSTILFTELLNDHWQEWKKLLDIRYARVLQSKNVLDELDVAFVEGALASPEQVKKIKEIRSKSQKFSHWRLCRDGPASAQRNQFDEERQTEIEHILSRFAYMDHVQKLSDVVKVDAEVPGCPMDEKKFLEVLNQMLKEFNIVAS